MNIIMIGRGVIATIYGQVFADAGNSVRHFVRPGRSAELSRSIPIDLLDGRKKGRSALESTKAVYAADCTERVEDFAAADLVFVCVRPDQMAAFAAQLRQAPSPKHGIVFFNNCWDDLSDLTKGINPANVLWAFPLAGGGFDAEGRLECGLQNVIHMEAAIGVNAALGRMVMEVFSSCGFSITRHADMRAWLWRHYALNAGFMALTMSRGIDMAQAMASPADLTLGLTLVREATKVVEARGVDSKNEAGESSLVNMPGWIARAILTSIYRSSPLTRRMMTIHGDHAVMADTPLRVLADAHRLNVACPELEKAMQKWKEISS